ncbi:helix-turn-helix domain-containing protein [Paenibacillus methanolicus]|uniref:AraC-like DNA-binding protein n=1 Tax=Paenibacillus methanolicus TaxID=582686 RepID=A0A5S5BM13_9BACL|nr:AraC family transcriptional regulator [Paenibacillus methanolicus]TYP68099.1 AraC-like DNA-binding protein [Paenibacillus methanolicus]
MANEETHRGTVNQTLSYIERHLTHMLRPDDLAREGRFSKRHFDRLFLAAIGRTAANYVRDRRLARAAAELAHTRKGILDIALEYHFQSQEAFTRAFKKAHGLTPGQYRAYAHSLVTKGTMGMNRNEVPHGWTVTGNRVDEYEVALDKREAHLGSASARIQSVKRGAEGFATLMQMFGADRYAGKRVRLTAFVKAEGIQGWAGLWMRVDRKNGDLLQFDNMQDRPIQGTLDWNQYAVVLDVSEASHAIAFGALLRGEGRLWVDNFRIDEVDERTPTTGQSAEEGVPAEPVNLDFEG